MAFAVAAGLCFLETSANPQSHTTGARHTLVDDSVNIKFSFSKWQMQLWYVV